MTRERDEAEVVLDELRRVVEMSLARDRGGQQVSPPIPGRMVPSVALHFRRLLAAHPSDPEAQDRP